MFWNFEPTILLGLGILIAVYVLATTEWRDRFPGSSPLSRRRIAFFAVAIGAAAVALLSPLDELSDKYLLMAHMVQHLLLTLIMAPALLLAIPGWMLRPLLRVPLVLPVLRVLTSAIAAYLIFNGVFAGWHEPALYDGALKSPPFHILEHLLFMATALLAWWPVCSPLPELPRLPYPAQILYLFFLSIVPTILGAFITFAPGVLYETYAAAPRIADVSALEDQQIAGLIMWLPGAFIYLGALTVVFFVWFEGKEKAGEIR
ncbi:MAG: cytochrome c oxidase assembly protein [Chloroflexi bacterium]|nr:cytochrome c oxidase assembly protein [Chloroflexota bacterium]